MVRDVSGYHPSRSGIGILHASREIVNPKSAFRLYRPGGPRYTGGMDLLIGCALLAEGILTLIAVFAVLSIPGRLDRIAAELARVNAALGAVDGNLDAIRRQAVETKRLVASLAVALVPVADEPPTMPGGHFDEENAG